MKSRVCPVCKIEIEDVCPNCGEQVERNSPWEDRARLGFFYSIFQTAKEVLFSPAEFFSYLTKSGGTMSSLLYALILNLISGLLSALWYVPFNFTILLSTFFVIPFVAIGLFVQSGILHTLLTIFSENRFGFSATFKVVAYSQSAAIWTVIPIVGWLISFFWQFVVTVVGLREMQRISTAKAVLACILPLLLFGAVLATLGIFWTDKMVHEEVFR